MSNQFLAQNSSYNYGLQVAVGDVTGNGRQDIITASMVGPPFVNVFLNNGSTTSPFAAYSSSTPTIKPFGNISGYQGGVGGLAVGNLTNNAATSANPGGAGDIIVGSGVGTKAIAQVFNYHANGTSSTPALTITPTFSSSVTGGLSVAVADVTGDGTPDLVMGAGTGGPSLVDVWNGKTKAISSVHRVHRRRQHGRAARRHCQDQRGERHPCQPRDRRRKPPTQDVHGHRPPWSTR